ncbi:MAG: hypothetical protein K5644_07985 [Lachnospiraceae bacterium]|nr:hypothetical protein [Lachnospiraceae bacterium]
MSLFNCKKKEKKSKAWYQHAIREINKLNADKDVDLNSNKSEKRTSITADDSMTVDDEAGICFSLDVENDSTKYVPGNSNINMIYEDFNNYFHIMTLTFQETLMEFISAKGYTNREFYKKAHIDRKLFSAIKNDKYYRPSKETVIECCFGLELCMHDAELLLNRAGYSLSLSITTDKVVYYCLDKGINDLDIVNELLYEMGEKKFF